MAVPGFWVGLFQGPEVERKDIKRGLLNVFYVFFVNLLLKFYKKTSFNRTKTVFLLLRFGDTLSTPDFGNDLEEFAPDLQGVIYDIPVPGRRLKDVSILGYNKL